MRWSAVLFPSADRFARAAACALALLVVLDRPPVASAPPARPRLDLPPIVFVARERPAIPGRRQIPGLGPHGRAQAAGGRLMLRERDGRTRALLADDALFDVSDPTVSFDARRVAFAGTASRDGVWRLWVVNLDGTALRPLTRSEPGDVSRFDDLDPCWVNDELWFASTRGGLRSQYDGGPVTNLWVVDTLGGAPRPLTHERNGAEEPCVDLRRGRVLFARWWFNRWRPSNDDPRGITLDPVRAVRRDSVNLWQTMAVTPVADRGRTVGAIDEQLACGARASSRRGEMSYQPAVLADGSVVGVFARNLGLAPAPGAVGIQRFAPAAAGGVRLTGAVVGDDDVDPYTEARGLAAPNACAPAALPDGRFVFAWDPGARGDFGLWTLRPGGAPEPVVDLAGTLELDPAPVVKRARLRLRERTALPSTGSDDAVFRFENDDVFAGGYQAPARVSGARLRFYRLAGPADSAGGDSAVLLREVPVPRSGRVSEGGLPAGEPLFEQLVGPDGRVLMTARGPAHVAGMNAGSALAPSRCIGCHVGHSSRAGRSR